MGPLDTVLDTWRSFNNNNNNMVLRVKKAISKPINPDMNQYFWPNLIGVFFKV